MMRRRPWLSQLSSCPHQKRRLPLRRNPLPSPRRKCRNGSYGHSGSIHIGQISLRLIILGRITDSFYRKLFTFCFSLNMIGLGLAASGHWPYAIKYNGAMAVANFNFAILMRNEIFGRLLYLFVNTLFAKVFTLRNSKESPVLTHRSGHL